MQDFEKLGVFYLGQEYDIDNKALQNSILLYDSKDLVTHAVCVGMTGSGKTGLCIGLLEEAAIDGIPSIIVDPKGDLANLLLTFPELKGENFLPWINEEEARKNNLTPAEYAQQQATFWKKGLADWGQDESRIARFKNSAEFAVYTPGSTAGLPVSILKSFAVPEKMILEDGDLLKEQISTTVTSLLKLLGIDADPFQSREHILLSSIIDAAWKKGQNMDLAGLIHYIQNPPLAKIGVFDLESFYPSKERFTLAMRMNNLLAAPGFQTWLDGVALDISHLFYTAEGKPRVSIFSIAHLNDAERMFFVSLLLTQLVGWMRSQSGTTSLRAIFYMDEIFGYFPPVANPPSKLPLLTLLKQARASGLGIVLATQNPVDLDYKGLSNTGTWFIGRLQTEQDKARVMDGLEGAGNAAGKQYDRQKIEKILSNLGKRVFLMNNVHEDTPVVFQTRWTMSYLRGPLTRNQIKLLMDPKKIQQSEKESPEMKITTPAEIFKPTLAMSLQTVPGLAPEIPHYFIRAKDRPTQGSSLHYQPMLLGIAKLYYEDAALKTPVEKKIACLASTMETTGILDWQNARIVDIKEEDFNSNPEEGALFLELPKDLTMKSKYPNWTKEFRDWLYRTQMLTLLKSPSLKIYSEPNESERNFRLRMQMLARENRDEQVQKVRQAYASKIEQIQGRIQRANSACESEKAQATDSKLQSVISIGATILGAFMGRKTISRTTLGGIAGSARRVGRTMKETKDIARAQDNLQDLQQQLTELQTQLSLDIEKLTSGNIQITEALEPVTIKTKKTSNTLSIFGLAWIPCWKDEKGNLSSIY